MLSVKHGLQTGDQASQMQLKRWYPNAKPASRRTLDQGNTEVKTLAAASAFSKTVLREDRTCD
jgi:hypothetical protein